MPEHDGNTTVFIGECHGFMTQRHAQPWPFQSPSTYHVSLTPIRSWDRAQSDQLFFILLVDLDNVFCVVDPLPTLLDLVCYVIT